VEVLCAVLILAIALVGLTEGITTALRSNKESELQTAAALIAAGQIETLKAEGVFAEGDKDGDCGPDLPLYRWKRSITKTTIAGLDEVEVTVEQVKTGKSIYELRTMLFQPPDDTGGDGLRKRKESGRDRRGRRGGRT
jgi:Tfp pilus assembly protein PilV